MKSYRMTNGQLRSFFVSQPKGSVVGIRGDDCSCPVASAYLSILPRGSQVSVSDEHAFIYLPNSRFAKKVELAKFIKRFIRKHVDGSGEFNTPITREEAIEMLASAYDTRNIYRVRS